MPGHQKFLNESQLKKIGKTASVKQNGVERVGLQDAAKNVQRLLINRDRGYLSPKTILSLQQTVGNRTVQRFVANFESSRSGQMLSPINGGQSVQRADYGYDDEPLHDSGTSQSQSAKTETDDDGGDGYGYGFGDSDDDLMPGGAPSGGSGPVKETDDDGGDGYGYGFGDSDDDLMPGGGPSSGSDTVKETGDDGGDGYGYEFGEDPLEAGGF